MISLLIPSNHPLKLHLRYNLCILRYHLNDNELKRKIMAIQKDGPNGAYIGKVRSVYGYVHNSQNISLGKRRGSTEIPTPNILMTRANMKPASHYATMLVPCFRYG